MAALEECHASGYLHTLIGGCNDAKRDVNRCLRAARLEKQAVNREKAKKQREKTAKLFKQIDKEY